jgi:hypothetical protein
MRQFEQDWLELGSRVARSLHYQHPRNLRLLQAARGRGQQDRAGRPGVDPSGEGQCPPTQDNAAHNAEEVMSRTPSSIP